MWSPSRCRGCLRLIKFRLHRSCVLCQSSLMRHILISVVLAVLLFPALVHAADLCTISVDRVPDRPYRISVSLKDGERHHWRVEKTEIVCTLAYFGLKSGTMVSCQFDPIGLAFVQSDRTVIRESPINNISFRFDGNQVYIETVCKAKR